jgi:superfamily II DNA or RNA helicase
VPDKVTISRHDENLVRIDAKPAILYELRELFSFLVPNYQFTTTFKNHTWDGKKRIFSISTNLLPYGLHWDVRAFCEKNGYDCIYNDPIDIENAFSVDEFNRMIATLNLSSMQDDGVREAIVPHDYQQRGIIHSIQARRALLLSATACHAAGTEVVMFNGTTKKVEDVVIGDLLMGPDSKPRTVSKLYHGQDEMFDVVPKDKGDTFRVNSNHILSLVATNQGRGSKRRIKNGDICNISVTEYLTKTTTFKHIHKLYRSAAISFPVGGSANRPIESYFLGVLLGDGGMSGAGVSVTTIDNEIVQEIYHQAEIFGSRIRKATKETTDAISYFFVGSEDRRVRDNWLLLQLQALGLYPCSCVEKFIPFQYKVGGIADRLQLLAGIIDTDGSYVNNSYYEISSKSLTLANDIAFVARSLGFYSSITTKVVKGVTYYRINVCGDIQTIPVKIARKKAIHPTRKKTLHTGFNVHPVGKGEYFGFELDGDHLYLLKDFTVTHNSGKSLMIYVLMRYYLALTKKKILILVPRTSLVKQIHEDFRDYAANTTWDVEKYCHQIYEGSEKQTDKRVVISTWQSLAVKERLPKEIQDELKLSKSPAELKSFMKRWNKQAAYMLPDEYFEDFGVVFGDEAHLFSSEDMKEGGELQAIMTKLINAKYRIGMTGSLKDSKVHHMILEGMFGPVYEVISARELIDQKKAAELSIKCIVLQYSEADRALMKSATYPEEMEFLQAHKARGAYIRNLALSLDGNTLILFEKVEKHGKVLHELIKEKIAEGRKLFFVHGKTPTDDRNAIRGITEGETNAIIVASYGTFSTGINIRNINNLIFASPTKAKIRVLQSIGRGLRLSKRKSRVTLFDIADDLAWTTAKGNTKDNYSLIHFGERINFYLSEQHPYKMYKIWVEGKAG